MGRNNELLAVLLLGSSRRELVLVDAPHLADRGGGCWRGDSDRFAD